jgi:ketosteroid isomerase-like protein
MRDLLRAATTLATGRARVPFIARSLAMTPRAELVRKYYGAYQERNRKTLEDGLTDDFTFTSPYDDKIDKATYFERCWPNSQRMTLSLEQIAVQADEAFVRYRSVTPEGKEFRNTEFLTFRGDKIATVDVYFGATYLHGDFVTKG